jgi:hypothetical protein
MRGYNIDLPSLTAASQKLISNKSKKDWAGFKTIIYMCRDQKATGNERGRGGAQSSTDKALTPKAAWTPKHQQQDNKSWHSSTDGHCGGGRGSGHGNSKPYAQQPYAHNSYGHSHGQQSQGQRSYGQQPQQQDKGWSQDDRRDANNQYSRGQQSFGQRSFGQQSQQQDKGGYQGSSNDRRDAKNQYSRKDDRDRAVASRDNNGRGHGSSDRDHGSCGRGQLRMASHDSRRDDRDRRDQRRSAPEVDLYPRQDRRGNDSRSDRSSDRRPSGGSFSRETRRDDSRSPRREHWIRELMKEQMKEQQNMFRELLRDGGR